jgi:hypothetical protein
MRLAILENRLRGSYEYVKNILDNSELHIKHDPNGCPSIYIKHKEFSKYKDEEVCIAFIGTWSKTEYNKSQYSDYATTIQYASPDAKDIEELNETQCLFPYPISDKAYAYVEEFIWNAVKRLVDEYEK